jgi:hypothetical protein
MSQVATAKQTGGGGVTYEDKVSAYFLICLLTETPLFNKDYGTIEKVKFQVRADGWLFDDILLYLKSKGKNRKVAMSVKSGHQFTSNGIPPELNSLLWQQYLKDQSDVFTRDQDALCLVEPPLPAGLSENLDTLLRQAYQQETGDMEGRQQTEGFSSSERRRLYQSFGCPPALAAGHASTSIPIDGLLKCFLHLEMDFEAANSLAEQRAIALCRSALKDPQLEQAISLYNALCWIAREQAGVAGYIDIPKLLAILTGRFQLRDFPSYSTDWQILEQHTQTKLAVILDSIGSHVEFPRNGVVSAIKDNLKDHKAIILHGISGSGKTVLAKKLALSLQHTAKVIWLDSTDFEVHSLQTTLGLTNALPDVIQHVTTATAFLIIDGAEKVYTTQQQQRMAAFCNTVLQAGNWKVLFTCPSESLSWLLEKLHQNNVNASIFTAVPVAALNEDEMTMLSCPYPAILPFLVKSSMRTLLQNLKLLDKLIIHINAIHVPDGEELGETMLIDFIWEEEIIKSRNGIQKGMFLQLMAEKQADNLSLSVSSAAFTVPDLTPVDELTHARFIQFKQERFYFSHDLYGDWARYKLLLSKRTSLPDFLRNKHLSSPLWARAIRFYAMGLLENESTVDKWRETFSQFDGKNPEQVIMQDLMLEALFFSHNAFHHLQKHKALLFNNNGELFKRLITLFDRRATTANPAVLELSRKLGLDDATAVTINRLPIWHYWLDVIRFIHWHKAEAIAVDCPNVGKLVNTWIQHTPAHFFFRKEASDIAIAATRKAAGKGYCKAEEKKPIYEAFLLSFEENPEEIKVFCKEICHRIPTGGGPTEEETNEAPDDTRQLTSRFRFLAPKRSAVKWEDGPYEMIEAAFQEVVLDTRAIFPIMLHDPALASEILLAVLIDEPKVRYFSRGHREDYCMFEPLRWNPPFYLRGPFIHYFRTNPMKALKFALTIIDFATERKLEGDEMDGAKPAGITVAYEGQSKLYKGDQTVFGWHKEVGQAPHVVVSILMAFEQFLYERIEKGEPVREYVRYAAAHTNSLAIVGVLVVAAKIQPSLYHQELLHLLPVYEFYAWDHYTHSLDNFTFWRELPSTWHAEVEKWRERKHRFFPLKDVVLNYWLNHEDLQQVYEGITRQWEEKLAALKASDQMDVYLLQIISQFRIENWQIADGQAVYTEPASITEYLEPGRTYSVEMLHDGHFAYRCKEAIDRKTPITLQEAEETWSKLQSYLTALQKDGNKDDFEVAAWASPYTNILAAMTVLIHFKSAWVETHPGYYTYIKKFCIELIEKAMQNDGEFNRPGTGQDWNIFLATIAARLWNDGEMDPECRMLVAGIVVQFNGKTVEKLMSEIGKRRPWNDPGFVQLQNFIVRFSAVIHLFHRSRHQEASSFQQTKEQLIDEFKNNTLSISAKDWSTYRASEKGEIKGRRIRPELMPEDDYTSDPGLYTPVLMHMLAALPMLESVRSDSERKHLLYLYRQGLGQIVYELGDITEGAQPIDNFPDDFNLFILKGIPAFLLLLTEEEQPASFWEPLFQYGYIAPKWIDRFCTYIFLLNVEKPDRHPRLVQLLKKMVEFSEGSTTWQTKKLGGRGEDFRLCLLGLQPGLMTIWTDDLTGFTQQAGQLYTNWFLKRKINPYAIKALLDFVITRSGEFIMKEALVLFKYFFDFGQRYAQVDPPKGVIYIGTPDHDAKLARVLDHVWKKKKAMLQTDRPLLTIFQDLVKYLVAQKNTLAMELQNELQLDA